MDTVKRHIIVVGTSAGGVEALQRLVAGLPRDLPAAVFVVAHIPPWGKSNLPAIITRKGSLLALQAEPEQRFQQGRIYIAPPDYHILLERESIRLWRGPKENRHRPSINALFRSAAVAHKERVIGVILSGALDDGSTGLWWVEQFGGLAIVQDPREAAFADMPQSALEHVEVDSVSRLAEMGSLLAGLAMGNGKKAASRLMPEEQPPWKPRNL